MPKTHRPTGRPSKYTMELAETICEQIALGNSLRAVCKQDGMPAMASVFKWLREHDDFSEQYARACEERTEAMAEDILDIADDGTNDYIEIERSDGSTYETINREVLQRSRLRVDTRKWLMSKMKPKKYGERIDMTTNGKDLPAPILGGLSTKDIEGN